MSKDLSHFKPHVPSSASPRELSLRALLLGVGFGLLFAIANAYLALKIGQTVSASIPAAILSMAILRVFFRNATILENNIVQTIATVGEALAAGVIFTIPALFLLGETPSIWTIFLLSSLGGVLGILLMIPMRRFVIVQEHKTLPFPEGMACAEILKAGEKNRGAAMLAFWGFCAAAAYKVCSSVLFLWEEVPKWTLSIYHKTIITFDGTPSLLGVGYLIGPRISGYMFAGGMLAWWGLIPLIKMFGLGETIIYPSTLPISLMSSQDIWLKYIRYIGAGTLAVGGLFSLVRIIPLLHKTVRVGCAELFSGLHSSAHVERTDRDISMSWLIIGTLGAILILWLTPSLPMNFFTICLLLLLSFFFVAVTSITVGLVGSTSNPVSGMTLTTLLVTCLLFVLLGWTERVYLISAILMGCVACVAIAMAGTTAQDLKAGFLLGATPRSQQIAELIGVILPSLALGYTVYLLNEAYQIGSSEMPAPQATLMAMIADGVMTGGLPYTLVAAGVVIGVIMAILGIPILPFALGLYLPFSLTTAMAIGGLIRGLVNRNLSSATLQQRGLLFASGLIGGDACMGVVIALSTVLGLIPTSAPALLPIGVGILAYLGLGTTLFYVSKNKT